MMTAATALFGLSSCNDSDSNNNSRATVSAISPSDFATGAQYYQGSVNGVDVKLQTVGGSDPGNGNVAVLGVNFQMIIAGQTYTANSAMYSLDSLEKPTVCNFAFVGLNQAADAVTDANFCKVWGIVAKEGNELTAEDLKDATFSIVISFPSGAAEMVAQPSDGSNASVSQYPHGNFSVKSDQAEVPSEGVVGE